MTEIGHTIVPIPVPADSSQVNNSPDAPFKAGASGKYKLLIQSVTKTYNGFEYGLVDADGKQYKAISKVRYPENDLLRCIVSLNVVTGHFVVESTSICKKQDLTSPVPVVKPAPKVKAGVRPQNKKKAGSSISLKNPQRTQLGYLLLGRYYKVGSRYPFTVTSMTDYQGRQIVRDVYGYQHPLPTTSSYTVGDEIRCTVAGYSAERSKFTQQYYLQLEAPRISRKIDDDVEYVKRPEKWTGEVESLGKHKCGKAFTCSCCGGDFGPNQGYRVDFKEIYFCNACARKIYQPKSRGNHHVFIPTPMGNKR